MKSWKINDPDRNIVEKIARSFGISTLAAANLISKGYSSADDIAADFNTSELSDPFLIKDMQKAVDAINDAIDKNERICVYGDYDCDGIMACVILYTYLRENDVDVIHYIPERSEGYGLNRNAIDKIHEENVGLIITVDNGISAISEAEYIYELGMKLVITDHHQQGESLPEAEAVVDPHRHDCVSPFKYACGAVIALKLVAAMNGGDYTIALEQFGDLAAIATVADIVSLTGENRFITTYGLERINSTDRPALVALKKVSGLEEKKVDSHSVGFGLAPRINAAGRFGSPKIAVELFLCDDYEKALLIAEEMNELNEERKNEENRIISEIYEMIDKNPEIIEERVIFICGKDWHHGVIGIVAARIVERFGKPCFIASEENGETRGSARSFGNFSVFDSLTFASGFLEKFGGHLGAGGFTIKNGMVEDFRNALYQYAKENHRIMPLYEIKADSVIRPEELNVQNIRGLSVLEPFGTGNEKPLFLMENAIVMDIVPLSDGRHTKLKLKYGSVKTEALIFRKSPREIPLKKGDSCDIIANVAINEYRNQLYVNIYVKDIRPCGFAQKKYFAGLNTFESFRRKEELPGNYYSAMLPTRDMIADVYKHIPESGIDMDNLFLRIRNEKLNYCRFRVAVEAMKQLGLVDISCETSSVRRIPGAVRKDIFSAPILIELNGFVNK